jgi:hypothetical protein
LSAGVQSQKETGSTESDRPVQGLAPEHKYRPAGRRDPGLCRCPHVLRSRLHRHGPDPVEHQPANLSRERPQPSLDKQRELHRIRGFGKDDEERVAGGFNFLAFAEAAQNFPDHGMMMLNHRDRFAVSKGLLEFGRIKDVGKKQSQQSSAEILQPSFCYCLLIR